MSDWSSYDNIAERYDGIWGSRFEEVARHLRELIALPGVSSVLDIGSGTGIVLEALRSKAGADARLVGCEKSAGMIRVARGRVPLGRFVEASALRLPFRESAFDVVTASFVLSHLPDCEAGLAEARRVLKPGGVFAMSSWSADADPHGEVWRTVLADVVPEERLRAAVAQVAPAEARFQQAEGVEAALTAAGFGGITVRMITLEYSLPLDHFLADREISSAGRFARHTLGADRWAGFQERAREELGRRFGPLFECSRGVLIGLGTRAARRGEIHATPGAE
jgi:demethylmenaquinone methyltransferase/2-methoxy-6-polyprenyl-1,4-benzoquinol methylase